jgi:hypothetical protein
MLPFSHARKTSPRYAAPAAATHHDHLMCREIAEPQPPIPLPIKAEAAMIDGFASACTDPAKHGQAWRRHIDDMEISEAA